MEMKGGKEGKRRSGEGKIGRERMERRKAEDSEV